MIHSMRNKRKKRMYAQEEQRKEIEKGERNLFIVREKMRVNTP